MLDQSLRLAALVVIDLRLGAPFCGGWRFVGDNVELASEG